MLEIFPDKRTNNNSMHKVIGFVFATLAIAVSILIISISMWILSFVF